jgi:hypothetical protein
MRIANAGAGANFGAGRDGVHELHDGANLLGNTNAADLGGRRVEGGNTVQKHQPDERDLGRQRRAAHRGIRRGLLQRLQLFTRFIPDNKVVVIGRARPVSASAST